MDRYERPREIIEFCLKPFAADPASKEYREAFRRMEHVIRTFQVAAGPKAPVAVDFSNMPSMVINEAAHGYEDAA